MNRDLSKRCRELLDLIRKIIQAIDIHSKMLDKKFGLTGPQLIVLHEVANHENISITPLSKLTSLRQATVSDIAKRLESKGYIFRKTREDDKRSVFLCLSERGEEVINKLPPLLQEQFTKNFSELENWEQMLILSSFDRVVQLMAADEIDASPVLVRGPIHKPNPE